LQVRTFNALLFMLHVEARDKAHDRQLGRLH
jgi:hypothetical protein